MEEDKDDQYLTDVLSYSAERLAKVNREYYYCLLYTSDAADE